MPATVVESMPPASKVEAALLDKLATEGTADLIVVFGEQADLTAAYSMGWEERGEYVYGTLKAAAERSQAGARAELETKQWRCQLVDERAGRSIVHQRPTRPSAQEPTQAQWWVTTVQGHGHCIRRQHCCQRNGFAMAAPAVYLCAYGMNSTEASHEAATRTSSRAWNGDGLRCVRGG